MGLIILASAFASCKKGSDNPDNHFKVGEKSYKVDTLCIYYEGSNSFGEEFAFNLVSPGIIIGNNGRLLNQGSFICLWLVTNTNDGIASGEYGFIDAGINGTPIMHFCPSSYYCLSFNVLGGTNSDSHINSGTLNVTRSGSWYDMTFTGTDDLGNKVTFKYSGVSVLCDDTKKK